MGVEHLRILGGRMSDNRLADIKLFYEILTQIEHSNGGGRLLSHCTGRMDWPLRGIYFIREPQEVRRETGEGSRIVRIRTHPTRPGSKTKLWGLLSQHRGNAKDGGGNHRGSIFRLRVGAALIEKDGAQHPTWGQDSSATPEIRKTEQPIERNVSDRIGKMTVTWLAVPDKPGPESLRAYIEKNAIALLSNFGNPPLDPPSPGWLGYYCNIDLIGKSGLWNSDYVQQDYDPSFLESMAALSAE